MRVAMRATSTSGSTPWRRMIDTGTPWLSSKIAEKRSAASIACRPAAARVVERELEQQLGGRRHAQVAIRRTPACTLQVLLERLQDLVRVQVEVAHHLREHVPLDLRERQEDVLVRQQRVLAAPGFLDRAVDDALRRFRHLVLRDIEVFHESSPPSTSRVAFRWSKSYATRKPEVSTGATRSGRAEG